MGLVSFHHCVSQFLIINQPSSQPLSPYTYVLLAVFLCRTLTSRGLKWTRGETNLRYYSGLWPSKVKLYQKRSYFSQFPVYFSLGGVNGKQRLRTTAFCLCFMSVSQEHPLHLLWGWHKCPGLISCSQSPFQHNSQSSPKNTHLTITPPAQNPPWLPAVFRINPPPVGTCSF